MRRISGIGLGLLAAGVVAGCGDEAPTGVGAELLDEGLRTVRVVLDAPAFLQGDTTYDQIAELNNVSYAIVANAFEGELDAHALFRVVRPFEVTYEDADGATQTDSLAAIRGGTVTLVLDSLPDAVGPIELAVMDLTEDWDRRSVSWDLRYDTAGVSAAWTEPGGTAGAVLGTATWSEGDTLEIPIDSVAATVWHDTIGAFEGGMIRLSTPGERLRIQSMSFAFDVVPTGTDTVLEAGRAMQMVSVASPDSAPTDDVLRVGGVPIWRSMLHFQSFEELLVPCEQGPTSCTVPLSEVTVNAANLLLRTRPPGARRPERPMRVEGRAVLEAPGVPLIRSPLSRPLGRLDEPLDVTAFSDPEPVEVRIPITGYVQRNAALPEDDDEIELLWLALTLAGEGSVFGYGEFGSVSSTVPPQLELVVTIPVEKVNP